MLTRRLLRDYTYLALSVGGTHVILGVSALYARSRVPVVGPQKVVDWLDGSHWWVAVSHLTIGVLIFLSLVSPMLGTLARVGYAVSIAFFNALGAALVVAAQHYHSSLFGAALCASYSLISMTAMHLPSRSISNEEMVGVLERLNARLGDTKED